MGESDGSGPPGGGGDMRIFPRRAYASSISDLHARKGQRRRRQGAHDDGCSRGRFAFTHLEQRRLLASTRANNCPALSLAHGPVDSSENRPCIIRVAESINIGIGDAHDAGGICCCSQAEAEQASDHLTKWNRSTRLISVGLGMLGMHLQTRTNTRNQSIHIAYRRTTNRNLLFYACSYNTYVAHSCSLYILPWAYVAMTLHDALVGMVMMIHVPVLHRFIIVMKFASYASS